ncbi:uncharacterized protein LOC141615418 [Silene latifolia]|uniref:uncharacterized protein LOC141615418 n=1 Tax=Silene latifolia TaxID=37657 RepID=UPI003D76F4B5
MMSPLSSVEEAAAILQQEESQRKNYKGSMKMEAENSAFYANQRSEENVPFCNKCKKKGHSLGSCWRVIGYLVGHPMHQYFPAPQNSDKPKERGNSGDVSRGYRSGMQRGKFQRHPNKGKMAAHVAHAGGDEEMTNVSGSISMTTAQFEQLMSNQKAMGMAYPETEDEMEANFAGLSYQED